MLSYEALQCFIEALSNLTHSWFSCLLRHPARKWIWGISLMKGACTWRITYQVKTYQATHQLAVESLANLYPQRSEGWQVN